jgi:AraC-like DNA-binding protein
MIGPRITGFSDVDEYRLTKGSNLEFTPLSGVVSGKQVTLNLPGFDITMIQSFPRIVDMQLGPNCTMVGFLLGDGAPVRFNGIEESGAQITIGGGHALYSAVERSARKFVSIVFAPEVEDRGWPISDRIFEIFETTEAARGRLQQIAMLILHTQFSPLESLGLGTIATAMKESLLAAVDAAVLERTEPRWTSRISASQYGLFRRIEELISLDLGAPIYSAELARKAGVSIRTLHNAIQRYRGMSLHRYLRIRRLWLVRRELLSGVASVKAAALTMGFWHLGDFSGAYKSMFGELPSETVVRAGQGHE